MKEMKKMKKQNNTKIAIDKNKGFIFLFHNYQARQAFSLN